VKRRLNGNGQETEASRYLWALRDINFQLKRGDSLALVGANGAGKTTILKLLAKITRPHSGRIFSKGRVSTLIELGAGFHPDLTGTENVYLNGAILGLTRSEINRHMDEIVEFSELERFMDTPLKRYSSGMAVRLGFAVASCVEPDILLVDEVLAVGDVPFRQKCINRIRQLLDKGTSMIFVSHNLWLVQAVCNTALYIDAGEIKFSGTSEKVIEAYEADLHAKRAAKLKTGETPAFDSGETFCEITKVEIGPFDGDPSPDLRPDRRSRILIHYMSYRDEERISLVLRIVRSDGVTCCMLRTKLDQFEIPVNRGHGAISLVLDPLQLRGGTYFVHVVARDGEDADSLATGSSNFFTVTGSTQTFSDMNGIFEPNRSWQRECEVQTLTAGAAVG